MCYVHLVLPPIGVYTIISENKNALNKNKRLQTNTNEIKYFLTESDISHTIGLQCRIELVQHKLFLI